MSLGFVVNVIGCVKDIQVISVEGRSILYKRDSFLKEITKLKNQRIPNFEYFHDFGYLYECNFTLVHI